MNRSIQYGSFVVAVVCVVAVNMSVVVLSVQDIFDDDWNITGHNNGRVLAHHYNTVLLHDIPNNIQNFHCN